MATVETKSKSEALKESLFLQHKNGCLTADDGFLREAETFCEGYKDFLNKGKTERLAAAQAAQLCEEHGFVPFDRNEAYAPGDKVYVLHRNKALIAAVIGTEPIANGVNLVAAHIDSPRIDLKPNPLYEDAELALCKTHYYGGIKKYQWTALPLSLHGVVVKAGGEKLEVHLGDQEGEPRFVINDLLPHLATEQVKRTLNEGVKGEELNVLVGSYPFRDDKGSELIKLNILKLLHEKYGMVEKDFLSAELELVPAHAACDVGFDRSMVGGYGQDDRVCAYPGLMALLHTDTPKRTAVTILADREEIGSEGNTGLNSSFLPYFIDDLAAVQGTKGRHVLSRSVCLSADVNAAFDPTFPDVLDKRNASFLNHGVALMKYTGSRGKSGTSDASAELMGRVRSILDGAGLSWQVTELGKVDLGGGGTVAMFLANLDIDVVDIGVPVLSMHSPFEVTGKFDIYTAYKAFCAFFAAEL